MRWLFAACLLGGCSLVWDPDGYVGDASLTDAEVDTLDLDPDTGMLDATNDAAMDADATVADSGLDADTCMRLPTDTAIPVRLNEGTTYENVRLTYTGDEQALIVGGADVVIRNVEIIITSEGNGIRINPAGHRARIEHVQVIYDGPVRMPGLPFQNQVGLQIRGDAAERVDGVRVTNFQVEGLEGIRIRDATDAMFTGVRVHEPQGRGAPTLADTHSGIELRASEQVRLFDFSIESTQPGVVSHALRVVGCSNVNIDGGLVSVLEPLQRFPISIEQRAMLTNRIANVDVTGAPAGLSFNNALNWTVDKVKVVRVSCDATDYAFLNTGSTNIVLDSCSVGGTCLDGVSNGDFGESMIEQTADGTVEERLPIDLCPF